ncbi:MAG: hypothetical protein ACNS60_21110 [Candidatus Cyclobacteriaceae bacterium M2_1C_046]
MKSLLFPTLIILLFAVAKKGYTQACPACSNPALQSSEKLEAGLDTLKPGNLRFTLNITNGMNYQGGHPNYKGLSENGEIVSVPLHNHNVNLDFLRTELTFEYTFSTNLSLWIRVPYDIKMQDATVEYPLAVTESEKESIFRNRDIHHRNENYYGISDLKLLTAFRKNGFISPNGRLDIAAGISLPTGQIEQNPLKAGQNGEDHLHIQFGTGTFDPLVELHYASALTDKLSFSLFTINRISFYENAKGYKGPFETTSGIGIGYNIYKNLTSRLTAANFSQSYAQWDGVNDPNSGLVSFNGTLNLTYRSETGFAITPGYRWPISQKTLSDEGDTFSYGPTFLLNISYLISK